MADGLLSGVSYGAMEIGAATAREIKKNPKSLLIGVIPLTCKVAGNMGKDEAPAKPSGIYNGAMEVGATVAREIKKNPKLLLMGVLPLACGVGREPAPQEAPKAETQKDNFIIVR